MGWADSYWHHSIVKGLWNGLLEFLIVLGLKLHIPLQLAFKLQHFDFPFYQTELVQRVESLVCQNGLVKLHRAQTALAIFVGGSLSICFGLLLEFEELDLFFSLHNVFFVLDELFNFGGHLDGLDLGLNIKELRIYLQGRSGRSA